jgi:hypothetical protein
MPEQQGRRGVGITGQDFTAPFDTPIQRIAAKGLVLSSLDAVPPDACSRLTNIAYDPLTGQSRGRPGQTALATAGTHIHSVRRINSPRTGSYTRIWGIDTNLYAGVSGALTQVDSGYSGAPCSLVAYRPPLSPDSWMFVGNSTKCRKVRASDGLDLPIGVAAPGTVITAALADEQRTNICLCTTEDGTDTGWTGTAGFGFDTNADLRSGPVNIVSFGSSPAGPGGVAFESDAGPAGNPFASKGYWYMAGRPLTRDLSAVGIHTAEDQDFIHVYWNLSHVDLITEVRVYLVCSETFTPSVVPGTQAATNQDFYMKAFSQHDFAKAILLKQSMVDAGEIARIHAARDRDLIERGARMSDDTRASWEDRRAERAVARSQAPQGPAGNDAWTELGVLGVPLRRGDFQRVGQAEGRGWATITGIIVQVTVAPTADAVSVRMSALYLYGGSGPDTFEPGAQQYDYRYTHYDTRTGAEGNPSPAQEAANYLDSGRREITLTPAAFGDSAMRQRFYRRGGSLTADWYYLGENTADGATLSDRLTDAAVQAAGTLEIDNYELVASIDEDGNTILAQPVPILFGPIEDLLLALGDPYRPGHVYWSKPGQPDSWPPDNAVEVCPPGEVLMTGGLLGGQAFCFSQEAMYWLYPNLASQNQVSASPTLCARGVAGRWAMVVTPRGIAFVNEDGIYLTSGGAPELLSKVLDPLFSGETVNGYSPIDFAQPDALRLEYHEHELWFGYLDTLGVAQVLVFNFFAEGWRHHNYGRKVSAIYSDEGAGGNLLLLGGRASGAAYTAAGTADDGVAITGLLRTGAIDFGRPREDKLLGDLILDVDPQGVGIDTRTYLNEEAVTNNIFQLAATSGRNRFVIDPFGLKPQKARTLSLEIGYVATTGRPILFQAGASIIPQPDLTINRVTQWDDLGHPDEVYLTGLTLDVDTGNVAREFLVEYDLDGQHLTLGPYVAQANNRHKIKYSWPVVKAHLVRIRPIGDCLAWILYRADWIYDPEPPRVARWDVNEENGWDQYVTGVDLDCNTLGATKTVDVLIDGVVVLTKDISTAGRRVVHLTVQPPVRGHLLRFTATDSHPGLLYAHRWHADAEPSEQTNWNQNYTVAGALPDKYLKGVILECDTFGQTKSVTIEVDGVVVETLPVNTSGRLVVERSFPQHLGRVFRLLPVDPHPGRLYSLQWIFDQEPLSVTRWESQLIDHGVRDFHALLSGQITLRSSVPVTLSITTHVNQTGRTHTEEYVIPSTRGVKQKCFVPFIALKGTLYKYVFTAASAFWLYREESQVLIQPWGASELATVQPFGNDDLTVPTRSMIAADLAASRSGGGTT